MEPFHTCTIYCVFRLTRKVEDDKRGWVARNHATPTLLRFTANKEEMSREYVQQTGCEKRSAARSATDFASTPFNFSRRGHAEENTSHGSI